MSAEYEQRLLARARELADVSEIRDDTLMCLGAARHAGLDPDALRGLIGCAVALGATSLGTYSAGAGWSGQHADERHFLGHIASIEDDIEERLHAARALAAAASAALTRARNDLEAARERLAAARRRLAAAHAMFVSLPCNGCHGRKSVAIAAAEEAAAAAEELIRDCETRAAICEDAIQRLRELLARLRYALARIRAVPSDLGETYESVYCLLRRGGHMPHQGRWITGEEVPA